MSDQQTAMQEAAASLDLVQRVIVSSLVAVVFGTIAVCIGLYVILTDTLAHADEIGMWVMSGVVGLAASLAIVLINKRKPYSPFVLLGLLPMAVTAYWLF